MHRPIWARSAQYLRTTRKINILSVSCFPRFRYFQRETSLIFVKEKYYFDSFLVRTHTARDTPFRQNFLLIWQNCWWLECEWRNVWNPIIPSRHQYDTDAPTEHFVETAWLQSRKDFDMSESPNVLPEGTTTPSSSVTSTAGSGKILLHALTEILCFTLPRSKWKGLTTVARWNKACILRKLSGILRSVNYFVGKLGNSGFEIWPKNHSDGWSSYSNINLKIQNSHFKRDFLSPPP